MTGEDAAEAKRPVFVKVAGFKPYYVCGKPTCYTLDGVHLHRSCAVVIGR